jgi:Tol biopolymer transport system component
VSQCDQNAKGPKWHHEIWTIDLDTKKKERLPIPTTDEVDDWSREGNWLVTVSDRHPPFGRGYQLYVMHPDGTEERRLTEGNGLNCYPRFRPGTNQLVYNHQSRGANSLWLVDLDGSNRKRILQAEPGVGGPHGSSWSPDGKWLAVCVRDNAFENFWIEIINPDGAEKRVLKLDGVTKTSFLSIPDWN